MQNDTSCKRAEENIKFVFKLSLRHLRLNYFKAHNLKPNIRESELKFYAHYFGDLAKRTKVPLAEFLDPLNFRTRQKTLNSEYIHLLFASTAFKCDFLNYLKSGSLKSEYQSTVSTKLVKLLVRFERILETKDIEKLERAVSSVQRYFRTNRQCKLPWTEREVDTAIENLVTIAENTNLRPCIDL